VQFSAIADASPHASFAFHTTRHFSGDNSDTQVVEASIHDAVTRGELPRPAPLNAASLAPQGDRKRVNRLFKQGKTLGCFSDQIQLRSLRFGSNGAALPFGELAPPPPSTRFYTEKKTLHWIAIAVMAFVSVASTYPDEAAAQCCHRRRRPLAMCRDFDRLPFRPLEPHTVAKCAPFGPFRTGLKIDSLDAHCDCIETFPHIG